MKTIIKISIAAIVLLSLSGCTGAEISKSECESKGYSYGIQNIFEEQIGCAKRDGDSVEVFNNRTGNTYTLHFESAGPLFKLKEI